MNFLYKKFTNCTSVLLVAFCYLILLIIFFHKSLFLGYVQTPGDIIYLWYPWKNYAPENFSAPKNYLLSDQILQFYPWFEFTQTSLKQGIIPLWNPYICCGAPFLANLQSSIFFPINLLTYFFPSNAALAINAVIRLFIAGFFLYLLLRLFDLSHLPAAITGAVFMLSGFQILWLGHPHTNVSIFLPVLFYYTEKIFKSASRKESIYSAIWLSFAIGFQYLGGHIETSVHILFAVFLFFIYRLYICYRATKNINMLIKISDLFLAANLCGILLAAVQIIPFSEYLLDSSAYYHRSKTLHKNFLPLKTLITFISPDFFGNPIKHNYWGDEKNFFNYNETVGGYIGILPLVLIILCCKKRGKKRNSLTYFFYLLALISLAGVIRIPLISNFIAHLPLIKLTWTHRMLLNVAFSLSILAGFGLENLWKSKSESNLFLIITLMCLLTIILYFNFSTYLAKVFYIQTVKVIKASLIRTFWYLLASLTAVIGLYIFSEGLLKIIFKIIFVIIILLDLFSFGFFYNPAVKKEVIFPSSIPPIFFFKNDQSLYRILSLEEWKIFPPNTAMAYKLFDVRGYDAMNILRYDEYLDEAGVYSKYRNRPFISTNSIDNRLKLLDLLNIKYILSTNLLNHHSLALEAQYGELKIYKNKNMIPRAFVVYSVKVINNKSEILNELKKDTFVPSIEAIIEEEPPISFSSFRQNEENNIKEVKIDYINPNKFIIRVPDLKKPAFLVISDTYYPGWIAYDNAKKIKIYRTNYFMKGVFLEPGPHTIQFIYSPFSFKIGLLISLATFSFLIAVFYTNYRKQI